MFIYKYALLSIMDQEKDAGNQLKMLIDYLGNIDQASIKLSPDNKLGDDILNSVLSAIKDHTKFFIQVVKSFDLQNLNGVLVYLFSQLIKSGFQVGLLRDLDYTEIRIGTSKYNVYLITEKYLDISDSETMKKLASLIGGHMPQELKGIPLIIGLTENRLKLVDKYRSEMNPEFIYNTHSIKNERSTFLGAGLILLSLTFFITFVGLIIDRPGIIFLSFPVVSWIIFFASLIGVFGFIFIITASMNLPRKKAILIAEMILIIASLEIISIYLQVSRFSISSPPDGLHLAASFIIGRLFESANLKNAGTMPIIYSFLSIILAFAFYFLFSRFSTKFFKRIGLIALIAALIGESVSIITTYHGLYPFFGGRLFIVNESDALFISFYNNISPLMPYTSIMLNTSDFLFSYGKDSLDIFYFLLFTIAASNLLFFVSYLGTGLKYFRKADDISDSNIVNRG